jgi:hypothetical protein
MDSDHPAAHLDGSCFRANDLYIINYSLFFAGLQWSTWGITWGNHRSFQKSHTSIMLRIVESHGEMGIDLANSTKGFCVYIRAFWIWAEGELEIP